MSNDLGRNMIFFLGGSRMNGRRYSIGIILIGIAFILLLGKLGVFAFIGRTLWPVLVLLAGLALHVLYFSRMAPSVILIPGGIVVTYSLMFLYCNVFGWSAMSYLWPGFLFGVAVGLYEVYHFDRSRDRGLLYAAIALAAVSVLLFGISMLFTIGIYLIIMLLIAVGAVLILRKPRAW